MGRVINARMSIALCICLCFIAGCSGDNGSGDSSGVSGFTFRSSGELEGYLKEQLSSDIVPKNTADLAAAEGDVQGGSYTNTTIQEAGVDESDVVRTDGNYLYIARGNEVAIVDAVPADAAYAISRIAVDGTVDSLYLYNKLLIIMAIPQGTSWTEWPDERLLIGMPWWISREAKTVLLFYDISDPAVPELMKEVEIEGNLISSRVTGGRLHVVLQFLPEMPALDVDYDGTEEGEAAAIERNALSLGSMTLEDLVPSCSVDGGDGGTTEEKPLVTYEEFWRPAEPAGGSIITITTFDLDDGALPFDSVGFVGDAHTVYASTEALYLITNAYSCGSDTCDSTTAIRKISLTDTRDVATGSVPGWIVNQFSLGEYDGVLRIATTDYSYDFTTFTNHVFCLGPDGDELTVLGRVDDITPGEKIYSARFIGNRGYLVTFAQVDPLITLDLSDPASPAVAGELVLPGYSTYIHPVDDLFIVTLGREVIEDEGTLLNGGVQLSLFNVENPSKPELVDQAILGDGGTESEALWNHKAFTFLSEGNLLAFPADIYEAGSGEDPWTGGVYSFSGLYVYRLDEGEGFEYLGRISTALGEEYFYGWWTRGVFIGDYVYAVNADAVRSADINDIESTILTCPLGD